MQGVQGGATKKAVRQESKRTQLEHRDGRHRVLMNTPAKGAEGVSLRHFSHFRWIIQILTKIEGFFSASFLCLTFHQQSCRYTWCNRSERLRFRGC